MTDEAVRPEVSDEVIVAEQRASPALRATSALRFRSSEARLSGTATSRSNRSRRLACSP